ncbi:hypothetical protein D3C75_1319730 [compost metagenome]|jgi:hypothetical protein
MSSYCFICHGNIRLIGPLTLEEATKELFELKRTFEGLYIEIIDEKTGRVVGRIPRRG